MASKKDGSVNVEKSLKELEALVVKLEAGQLPLDEAISAYEQGMELASSCKQALDKMSQKITLARDKARAAMGLDTAPAEPDKAPEDDDGGDDTPCCAWKHRISLC